MTYFDTHTHEWSLYYPQPDRSVLRVVPAECVTGIFLSREPPDTKRDIEIPLLTFLFQRCPTKETFAAFETLYSDLENALALIEKQIILFTSFTSSQSGSYFEVMRTEIEYALFNTRSFYDLLNRFVIAFLKKHSTCRNFPPDSFRKTVQQSESELCTKYGFSTLLARFYKAKQLRFMVIRGLRDLIGHQGTTPPPLFLLPDGFGFSSATRFSESLKKADLWPLLHPRENDIASCMAFVALLCKDMFSALDEFTTAFKQSFPRLPKETSPGHQVYARMRFADHYQNLNQILDDPWNPRNYAGKSN